MNSRKKLKNLLKPNMLFSNKWHPSLIHFYDSTRNKKNHEILVPALTFVGTVNAICYTGAEPHFIDSNIKDLGVD